MAVPIGSTWTNVCDQSSLYGLARC